MRVPEFKSSLWSVENLLLKDAFELLHVLCDQRASGAARILVSFLTADSFPAELDLCPCSSLQGFWWAVCRFYWTSVNPWLGCASSDYSSLFLGLSALGFERKGLGNHLSNYLRKRTEQQPGPPMHWATASEFLGGCSCDLWHKLLFPEKRKFEEAYFSSYHKWGRQDCFGCKVIYNFFQVFVLSERGIWD